MFSRVSYILLFLIAASTLAANYPDKPITFIVHSKPGSAIDITTRRLTQIASKYTDATLLVENKTGASGIVAMREVLSKKADGYTVLAVTKSFISTVLMTKSGIHMDDFYFLACLVIDPEVLITNRKAPVRTLEQIIRDAKEKQGKQKWLGPLVGGVDHLMALKTWEQLGIRGEWIPFEGGSDALAALMGRHGTVYVGNPVDVKGRPDLMIAAVSAERRLPDFPRNPTFLEKGFGLKHEVLWRGYALKQGTDPRAVSYLTDLIYKVSRDSSWLQFVRATSAQPVFLAHEAFSEMVQKDQLDALKYLRLAGILADTTRIHGANSTRNGFISLIVFLLLLLTLYLFKREWFSADFIIPLFLIILSFFLYGMTIDFPSGKLSKTAGPAAMPRLWIYGLIIFNVWLLIKNISLKNRPRKEDSVNKLQAVGLAGLMFAYIIVIQYLGYYISTFLFLTGGSYLLDYRKTWLILLNSVGFTVLSYFIFYKILQVPLPTGLWG